MHKNELGITNRVTSRLLAFILPWALFISHAIAGGGGGSIVFDPTNYAQNIISAGESVKATADRAIQIRTQYLQYATQLKQLQSIAQGDLAMLKANNLKEIQNITGFIGAVKQTYGDIERTKQLLQRRFDEQSLSGLPWADYVAQERMRIERGVQSAKDRAEIDRRALEKVNSDYEQVREWQDKIGATEGMHEAIQLSNMQMNKLVTQNAEMIKAMTLTRLEKHTETLDQLAKEKRAEDEADLRAREIRQANTKANTELNRWAPRR